MNKEPGLFNVAVAVLIEKEGKILITQRSPNRDHAPNEWEAGITGRVDQGETFEEALLREVFEETSLKVKIIAPFNTFHFYRGEEKKEHLGLSFWTIYESGEVELDHQEQVDYKWVTPEEAFEYIKNENVIKELNNYIKFKTRFTF